MSTVTLRTALPEDADALAALAHRAFVDAFAGFYSEADLSAFLAEWKTPAVYAQALADPQVAVMLAEVDGQMAAYCLLKRGSVMDDHPHPRPLRPVFLSQLYCAGKMTGHGLGTRLMDWAVAQACAWQADSLSLSVWSQNPGAQRLYQRYGFAKVADTFFMVGNQRDDELLFELRL
jgi:diamine N-acetyltransferase